MDNNDMSDPLTNTVSLPELSFDDLLETSKSDSLIESLDDSLGVRSLNEGANIDQANKDFVEQKNDPLSPPGSKKPPVKILENRKLMPASLSLGPTAAPITTQPTAVVKAATIAVPQSAKVSAMVATSAAKLTSIATTDSKPNLFQTSVFKITQPKSDVGSPTAVGGIASGNKKITGAATLTTIDGKAAVKTADGKILFIQKAPGGGNSSARVGQLRLQTAMTSGNMAKSAALVPSKNLKCIGATTVTVATKLPITTVAASIGSSQIKPIVSTSASLTKGNNIDRQTTAVMSMAKEQQKTIIEKAVLPAPPAQTVVPDKKSSVGAPTASISGTKPATLTKTTSKPVQIQIVRTADGKLLKINRTAPVIGSGTVSGATTTTLGNKIITKQSMSASTTTTTNAAQMVLKAPLKKLSPELLAKSINLKKLTSVNVPTTTTSEGTSNAIANSENKIGQTVVKILSNTSITTTVSTTTTKPTVVNVEAVITKPSIVSTSSSANISTTVSKSITTLPTAKPFELVKAISTTSSAKLAAGTTPLPTKILNKLSPVSNVAAASTATGRTLMQSAIGKQIVVSNQNLVKLSPKPAKSPVGTSITSVAAGEMVAGCGVLTGKLQAVQLAGNSGIKYVRVLPKGSTIPGSGTVTSSSKLIVAKPSASSATSSATIAPSVSINSSPSLSKPSTVPTTILNSTLTSSSGLTSSATAGYKLLNSAPQKFTLVRSQGGNSGTTKFLLKQSPGKDGPLSVVSLLQKKVGAIDGRLKVAGSATTNVTSSIGAAESNARKHKISDINMEIKRITAHSSTTSGNSSDAARDDSAIIGPEPKRARYVFMPRTAVLQKSGNSNNVAATSTALSTNQAQIKPGVRPGYSLQRLEGAENAKDRVSAQAIGVNKSGKQMYSILRTSKVSSSMKSYVVCNTATGQKSITIRRPFSLPESVIGKSSRKFITSADLERRDKLAQAGVVRSHGTPVKFSIKPQYESLKQSVSAVSSSPSTALISATSSVNSTASLIGGATSTAVNATYDGNALASRRKHCNCSKSQCLKLYCDCFANGEFCQDCTCKDCFNNLQYEDERQRAIKSCLDRNPSAFKPKITARQHSDMRLHNKGCNCKRSGCLKNYCECYEAKIPCSSICKCVGCRNMEDRPDVDMDSIDTKAFSGLTTDKQKSHFKTETDIDGIMAPTTNNFITEDVIDATIMCMISQLVECENQDMVENDIEKQIMEELGRCLVEIIDFSIRNSDSILLEDSTKAI